MTDSRRNLIQRLPADLENRVHQHLRVARLCTFKRISKEWSTRVGHSLESYWWDIEHVKGVDPRAHVWLAGIARARVKVGSLHMDKPACVLRCAAIVGEVDAVKMIVTHYDKEKNAAKKAARMRAEDTSDTVRAVDYHLNAVARMVFDNWNADPRAVTRDHDDICVIVNRGGRSHWTTALHYAARKGHLGAVKCLATAPGVDLNARTRDGGTPLHWAVWKNRLEVVKYLVRLPRVDLNATNNKGETPLHIACRERLCCKVAEALVAEAGVNLNARDWTGKSPLEVALFHRCHDVAAVLRAPRINGGEVVDVY